MAKIIADECCDAELVEILRAQSHDVSFILEILPGASDEDVIAMSVRDGRILVTEDKDFCELVFRLRRPVYGIILLRFDPIKKQQKYRAVSQFINEQGMNIAGKFVVIEGNKVRIRSLSVNR